MIEAGKYLSAMPGVSVDQTPKTEVRMLKVGFVLFFS